MKWPERLVLVRHAESSFNQTKSLKNDDPLYQEFLKEYEKNYLSKKAKKLADQVWKKYSIGKGDHNTPLSEAASRQAIETGKSLKETIKLPDVVFTSPYERTCKTFELMCEGWPELRMVKRVLDDRVIEQDHGAANIFNDWRIFHVFNPEQKVLRELMGPYYYRYPQGENVPDVRERIRSWLGTLTRDYQGQTVLAVTHHLTILAIRANLERLDADEFDRLDHEDKPINCGVTIYEGVPEKGKDGKLELEVYNAKYY